MLKIIRCGEQYCLVILVSPPDAEPETKNAKFYRYANWNVGDQKPDTIMEISHNAALNYFSGQADGLGYETYDKDRTFASSQEALEFIKTEQTRLAKEYLKNQPTRKITANDLFSLFLLRKGVSMTDARVPLLRDVWNESLRLACKFFGDYAGTDHSAQKTLTVSVTNHNLLEE